jgi:hypothetical protein
VPWEEFRPTLEHAWRKPMDAVLMFKTLVLSALYNLSDDQIKCNRTIATAAYAT